MSGDSVVIQCATPQEFAALQKAFGAQASVRTGKREHAASLGREGTVLRGSVGKVWAAASTEFAIARFKPTLVIDFGAAGALTNDLRVGDLVIADRVVEHDVAPVKGGRPSVDVFSKKTAERLTAALERQSWIEGVPSFPSFAALEGGLRATRGVLAAGDADVQSVDHRRELAKAIEAIAVCWEASAVGRVCRFHDVLFLSVRVVTDIGSGEFIKEYLAGIERSLLPAAEAVARLVKGR